jgi:hypothetical protein
MTGFNNLQRIPKLHRVEYRFQVMETIRPLSGYLQSNINL